MKTINKYSRSGPARNSFTIYWVGGEYRLPLEVSQMGGAGDHWYVFGGGYNILNLYPDNGGGIYYIGNDFSLEDIQALVDVIAEITLVTYNEVSIKHDDHPSNIGRLPPYFEPLFRNTQQEISYYRKKLRQAKMELEWRSERKLKGI